MNYSPKCVLCTAGWLYERLTSGIALDDESKFRIVSSIFEIFAREFNSDKNPAQVTNVAVERLGEVFYMSRSHFEQVKRESNEAARGLLTEALPFLEQAESKAMRLRRAISLALLGNVAPIGSPRKGFEFSEIRSLLEGKADMPAIEPDVINLLSRPLNILYIADNAGEIGFDALLIKELKRLKSRVSLIVKKDYFFDDADIDDASYFYLEEIADKIFGVQGIFLPEIARGELNELFETCDIVISKGTGNFEGLNKYASLKTIIFLLKIKCDIIEKILGVSMNNFVAILKR